MLKVWPFYEIDELSSVAEELLVANDCRMNTRETSENNTEHIQKFQSPNLHLKDYNLFALVCLESQPIVTLNGGNNLRNYKVCQMASQQDSTKVEEETHSEEIQCGQ